MSTNASVSQLENRIAMLEEENKKLHDTVAYLTRKLFGSSSEKASALGLENQLSLFDEVEISQKASVSEPTLSDALNYNKKKFKGQKKLRLKDLPHEKQLCTLAEEDCFCDECGSPLYLFV